MVVQRTIDNLRQRPQEERVMVAGSIAIGVVALLLVGWVVFFLRGMGGGEPIQATAPQPAPTTQGHSQVAPPTSTALQWQTDASATGEAAATPVVQGTASTTSQ